ncbi:DUF3299 domain-containing protein [Sphingorhabdus sp. 109]|jgi:hypothetical protein|uniref:DUF3299 domain-containing protein n=1 Tax=Sphingorhabdus sp. 109 TaxID=2653173 RepID=UPI0012F09535|nr:DUF3299 domain-containing protein [Sphingorhabdus sp. 109]VWX60931.1 conserved exported hypothetical protein [Sphingorhabdus sp. 109]
MKILYALILASATFLPAASASSAMQNGGKVPADDVWKPARTPKGGVSWAVLESTKEKTRTGKDGYIYSKPLFSPAVKSLAGKRIKVAGWMTPLEQGARQKRFVLLAYPPGCPFHFHAMPNQFIEVLADIPFPTDERKIHVVSGILELTGQDESGIFYRLKAASPAGSK